MVLDGADLSHANLSGIDLRTVSLHHVRLVGTDLRNANLEDVQFGCWQYSDGHGEASGVLLAGANLGGASFCDYQMTGVDLRGRDLRTVDFAGARLDYADFRDANLSGVELGARTIATTTTTTAVRRCGAPT